MIQVNQPTQTVSEPIEYTDSLLQAGSKISLGDLYQRQLDLPITKNGKYYAAKDVDSLSVLTNRILKDVSEQAVRQDKELTKAREENAALRTEITQLKQQLERQLMVDNQADQRARQLQQQVDKLTYDRNRLAVTVQQLLEKLDK